MLVILYIYCTSIVVSVTSYNPLYLRQANIDKVRKEKEDVALIRDNKISTNLKDLRELEDKNDDGSCYWSEWSPWANCSVTCGRGRQIRWRERKHVDRSKHCDLKNEGDYELEERVCFTPDCSSWGKLLEGMGAKLKK